MQLNRDLCYKPKSRINKSSQVFKGNFSNIVVAVKFIKNTVYKNVRTTLVDLQKLVVLGHPNIIRIYSVGLSNDLVYIGQDLCDTNLESLVKIQDKKVSKNIKILKICQNITEGLNFLHTKDIIHNNLHPRNVLVILKSGIAKISDCRLERVFPRIVIFIQVFFNFFF